jgi:hypothetical protein
MFRIIQVTILISLVPFGVVVCEKGLEIRKLIDDKSMTIF